MKAMAALMASLREKTPVSVAGRKVLEAVDYLGGDTGLIPSDVLEFRLEGGAKLIVRPSGTKPKLKVYLSVRGDSQAEADSALEALSAAAGELVNS